MNIRKGLSEKLLLWICLMGLIGLTTSFYLIVSSDSSTKSYMKEYNLFLQFRSDESTEDIVIILNNENLSSSSIQTDENINEKQPSIESSIHNSIENESTHTPREEIDYTLDEITYEEKDSLKNQYGSLITKIDNIYKRNPVKNILKDIIPWKKVYEKNEFNSELLYMENYVTDTDVLCTPFSYGYSNQAAEKIFSRRIVMVDCPKYQETAEINTAYIKFQCSYDDNEYILDGVGNNQELGTSTKTYL